MFGQRAKSLIDELKRSDFLPAYNDEGVRLVLEEVRALQMEIDKVLGAEAFDESDTGLMAGLIVRNQSIARNKRCLLAYINARAGKLEEMRHDHGSVLPPEVTKKMHSKEVDYFKQYDKILADYMAAIDLDLTSDMHPPKQLNIEVHVLKSYGEIMTPTGTVTLTKGDRLSLRRTDVEHLIRQGVVEETNE